MEVEFHFGEILDCFRPFYYTESDEKHNKRIRESTINFNQNSLSLSLSHILPSGVFVSRIGVDGRSKRRRRRRGRRVGIGGGSGSPWSGVELRLYMRKPTASPVMDTVRTRRVYRIRHRQCSDHTLSLSLSLSVFSSILVVEFRSGVEWNFWNCDCHLYFNFKVFNF